MQQDPSARTMVLNTMQQQKNAQPAQCNKIHQLEQWFFCPLLRATRCYGLTLRYQLNIDNTLTAVGSLS